MPFLSEKLWLTLFNNKNFLMLQKIDNLKIFPKIIIYLKKKLKIL